MKLVTIAFYGSILVTLVTAAAVWGVWPYWETMALDAIGMLLIGSLLYGVFFVMPVKVSEPLPSDPTYPAKARSDVPKA